ncbi:hypothetical protein GCM10023186_31960 [Hymenobacter koreensis]|uniref:CUB domain-containing protein n=1 Tax=Hymenobacter koreensis TaxID=1084523 RepID=A0ABP8J8L3_9BACT
MVLTAGVARSQTYPLATSGTSTITTCSGTITNTSAGGLYPPDQNVTLTIRPATVGSKVSFTLANTFIEQGYDFLSIYNGSSTAAPLLATLTGNVSGTYTATAADGSLTIVFQSDAIIQYPGWTATIACVQPPPRVGIGTSSPTQALEVAGQVFSNTGGFRFPDNSVQTTAASAPDNLGNHTATQNLRLNGNWLSNDGGNEGLRIDNSGNVGVGTATPSARLEVAGSSGSPALRLSNGTMVLSVSTAMAPTTASTLSVTAAVHYFVNNANPNGNVTLSTTGAQEGQVLLVGNFDAQALTVAYATSSTSIPANGIAQFVFLNSGWRLL